MPVTTRSLGARVTGRTLAGAAGGLVLVAALASPLRSTAGEDVGAHMVQHLLLMSVAAPLLALAAGDPIRLLPWPRARRWVLGRGSAMAAGAGLVYAVVLWGWHLPVLYDAAVDHDVVHAAEHLTMLGAGVAWWSVVLAAGRGVSHVASFALVVPTAIHSAVLGAVLTFAPRPLYDGGAASPADALAAQQLAGTLMWGIGGVPFMAAAAVLVATWLRRSEARSRHRAAVRATVTTRTLPVVALVVMCVVAACGDGDTSGSTTGEPVLSGADADAGRHHIESYGCGSCHDIPGVQGADAQIAPPLGSWSDRSYIAGALPNEPENLVRWIMNPQAVEPGTAMPNLEIDRAEARDIAEYLLSLD